MFSHCHHFDINGGDFNNVQGNQHNYHHNTTNHVRGSHNTYKTINRGNYNVTNNGVDHGWGWDYGADDDWDDDDDFPPPPSHFQQSRRPRMPYTPSDPAAYGYDDGSLMQRNWEHPAPPRSAPPVMTENPEDRHHLNGPSSLHTQSFHPHPLDPSTMRQHPALSVQDNSTTPTPPTTAAPEPMRTFGISQLGLQPSVNSAPIESHSLLPPDLRNVQHASERNGLSSSNAEATSSIPDPDRHSPSVPSSGLLGSENSRAGRLLTPATPPATHRSQTPVQDSTSAQSRLSPQRHQISSSERRRDFPVPPDSQPQTTDSDNMAVDEDQDDNSAQR
ncbi:hypothetical protein VNI00_012933 [Paramarasmius palmivorus]|uniref:Uncharacterized protein n=1 Tax=Paramarasmius palmivorus TaxID=297713 RepID=A0AAW0C091_9AGAR